MTAVKFARWTEADDRELITLWAQGHSRKAICDMTGRTLRSIEQRAHHLGIRRRSRARLGSPSVIVVPAWVPTGLTADYIEIAAADGEEAAASWARAEKRKVAA